MRTIQRLACLSGAFLLIAFLPGCKTTPPIDWGSRVGVYTYDESVLELGPPDRMTLISTGRVAEWLTGRSTSPRFSFGVGSYGGGTGVGVGTGTGGGVVENILRLTFDKEDKLVTWENTRR
jgi:hypothetical protein